MDRKRKSIESILQLAIMFQHCRKRLGEEQKEEEEKQHSLKMNFSVGVNMYREKVTSY